MESDHATEPRRCRLRFSLRTLLIVLLSYAALWTLTALFAGSAFQAQFLDELERRAPGYLMDCETPVVFVRKDPGPKKRIIMPNEWAEIGSDNLRNLCYVHAETTAFAPFLYRADAVVGVIYQQDDSSFQLSAGPETSGRSRMWCLWLFGLHYRISETDLAE